MWPYQLFDWENQGIPFFLGKRSCIILILRNPFGKTETSIYPHELNLKGSSSQRCLSQHATPIAAQGIPCHWALYKKEFFSKDLILGQAKSTVVSRQWFLFFPLSLLLNFVSVIYCCGPRLVCFSSVYLFPLLELVFLEDVFIERTTKEYLLVCIQRNILFFLTETKELNLDGFTKNNPSEQKQKKCYHFLFPTIYEIFKILSHQNIQDIQRLKKIYIIKATSFSMF